MKKALIICAAGMSSSLMAKKVTEYFASQGKEIVLDAVSATEGGNMIKDSDFSLFLISPQTMMMLDKFKKMGDEAGKPVVSIPFQAYIPIQSGIEQLAKLTEENLK
ncbi:MULTISPECIES: PTS cellobiose transporter subunit IIB [unclassified Gilliamella]|uniref:PTS cellobiose transporter subunit IIB n=1 Tax=unclassified Gilliamella TaxID=2685620 RepID=UPI001C69990A|nr:MULTISPECIES: PTS cellobiose transporter subunit IIB [unclassified Gilliamella]MCX8601004.1 PTS cellobiose transporter subunit IIB [Gilliamella sp. B3722]MCX8607467.1 PTS cellobiose transporter subunit IIB [Gilliamella sp. B3771]MCX8610226.1 PTS cellobiose transporter subunit IIB [Gilliamella sp. B3891]MCX8612514.1 PTS cellobiose transporter subunit IIB [Gilliamella sp. B3773]MCX8616762.1 PTS cellobiose transporter subunit IIB [Gilliamella sp. B3770]